MKHLFTILLLLFFSIPCFAQSEKVTKKSEKIVAGDIIKSTKINLKQPSVYITFEKYGYLTSNKTEENLDIIQLRLYNNTRGDISLCGYDLSQISKGEIGLQYQIAKISSRSIKIPVGADSPIQAESQVNSPSYDICDDYKLKSGKSILFKVSKEHLAKDYKIIVQFFYSWEDVYEATIGKEPWHFIYFTSYDLPN